MDATTGQFVFPRIRQTEVSKRHQRLGHPALLRDTDLRARGRISGEILYDLKLKTWVITNGSGRYGMIPGRTAEHLSNVAAKFEEHGITLKEDFRKLRQR